MSEFIKGVEMKQKSVAKLNIIHVSTQTTQFGQSNTLFSMATYFSLKNVENIDHRT